MSAAASDPLVGRRLQVSVIDGYALYEVRSVNEARTLARLVLVDGGPDDYSLPIIGESCAVSYENVAERVAIMDANHLTRPGLYYHDGRA